MSNRPLSSDKRSTLPGQLFSVGGDSFVTKLALVLAVLLLGVGSFAAQGEPANPLESVDAVEILAGQPSFTKYVIDNTVRRTHTALGADFDGDGDMDLVATNYKGHAVYYYENKGQMNYTRKVLDGNLSGAYPAGIGDVDKDGDIDIMAAGYLAGLRAIELHRDSLDDLSGPLQIWARRHAAIDASMMYQFEASHEGKALAAGRITIAMQPGPAHVPT